MPYSAEPARRTFATAATELMAAAASGVTHAYDVGFGRDIVRWLQEVHDLSMRSY